ALTDSALLVPTGGRVWAFAHRSFQEYLAAEYLKAHQSRSSVVQSLVMVGEGSTRHALPAHREVAAWLALTDDALFDDLVAHDPEPLLLADLQFRSDPDRAKVVAAILEQAAVDYTQGSERASLLFYRLDHRGLATQLAQRLQPSAPQNELLAVLRIARECPQ